MPVRCVSFCNCLSIPLSSVSGYCQQSTMTRSGIYYIINIFYCTGNPDGTWTVDLPAAEVPPEMPEPVLGINFARNGTCLAR